MPSKVTTTPKLFIGHDIHKSSWKCHFATDISIGTSVTMPPDSEKLLNYVEKYFPDHEVAIAYETGCCGYNPARDFIEFGWNTYVVNPADIPRPSKQGVMKTDKIDAKNIALQLRAGNLKKITIPSIDRECLRNLTRRRSQLVTDLRRIKNQIKSLLLYHSIKIPEELDNPHWSKKFLTWLKAREWNYRSVKVTFDSMIANLEFLDQQLKLISNEMRAYCRKHHQKDYDLLRSVPGIAGLSACYIIAELGDIRRFSNFKKFASYVGTIPNIYSSGDNITAVGVNPRANRTIRSLIVEASWVAVRTDPALQQYFRKHATNNSKGAIFKVARKLLSRILAVMKTNTPYEIGVIQ